MANETEAEIGYGGEVTYDDTPLPQVVDITAPDLEVPEDKVSSNDGPAWHEYIPKMGEPGTITFNIVYTADILATLMGILRQMKEWAVNDPDGSSFSQDGFIKSLKKGQPLDSHNTIDVVVKLSGEPVFDEG